MAGCFNDTCSVVVTQTTGGSGGAYEVDVQLSAAGAIECIDGQGLAVNTVNDVLAAPGCWDILRHSDAVGGPLHATLPNITIQPFTNSGNVPVLPAVEAASSVKSTTQVYTNNTGCDVTVIAQGTWNLLYAVLSPDSPYTDPNVMRLGYIATDGSGPASPTTTTLVPFNAMWGVRILADNNSLTPTTAARSNRFATSGTLGTFDPAGFQFQTERRSFTVVRTVPAGAFLGLRGDIFHEGNDQTMNVVASGSGALADLGFTIDEGSFIVLPFVS